MARAPDPRIEQAKALYKKGMKLVEIASQLNLPEGTVRRWKHSYNWDNERSDKKSERSEKKKTEKKKRVAAEVDDVCENHELTDKQTGCNGKNAKQHLEVDTSKVTVLVGDNNIHKVVVGIVICHQCHHNNHLQIYW